jgi:RNA polymerase sigma factor (sigma-70 family)
MSGSDTYGNTRVTLIKRIHDKHDEQSWDEFVGIYGRFIYAVVRKMNVSEHDAEDLTQQMLVNLWQKIPELDATEIKRFRNWIASITRNFVIDYFRKQSRETKKIERASQEDNLDHLKSIRLPEIDAIVQNQWRIHITSLAMENIKPLFSANALEVFQLSLKGKSVEEIATELGLKEKSVSQLKSRVKKRLTEEVERLREELE